MNYISMNAEMTKDILDGRKTQARIVITSKPKVHTECTFCHKQTNGRFKFNSNDESYFFTIKSKYQIGDKIWVREPVKIERCDDILKQYDYKYLSDGYKKYQENIPKRVLFNHTNAFIYPNKYRTWLTNCQKIPNGCIKEMARIFLEITDIRVERLNDITFDGIKKEGLPTELITEENILEIRANGLKNSIILDWWIALWNKVAPINYKWEDNPYMLVYEFKRVDNV